MAGRPYAAAAARPIVLSLLLEVGFLDGSSDLHYRILMAIYDYLIRLKVIERRQAAAGTQA